MPRPARKACDQPTALSVHLTSVAAQIGSNSFYHNLGPIQTALRMGVKRREHTDRAAGQTRLRLGGSGNEQRWTG